MSRRPDPRQFDLFAAPVEQPAPQLVTSLSPPEREREADLAELADEEAIAEAEAEAERAHPAYKDDDENERGEWRDDAQREQYRVRDLANDGRPIEELAWQEGKKRGYGRGQGYFSIRWFEDEGRFYVKHDHSSGGGPFGEARGIKTRDELILSQMRAILRTCARAFAMRDWSSDTEAEWQSAKKRAAWAIGQCPALIYGADLGAEFEAMKAQRRAAEEERRRMLGDVDELRNKLVAAIYDAQGREKPPHVSDWFANTYGTSDDAYSRADVQLQGDWPNRLRVMIYPARPHHQRPIDSIEQDTPEQLEAYRAELAKRLPVPVLIASREYQVAHYYESARREVTWPSDQHRAFHLRQLGMDEA